MDNWVTYSDERYDQVDGWHIWTIKATAVSGLQFFRWCKSRNRNECHKWALWKDKARTARTTNKKYFLSREEAFEAALASVGAVK